MKNKIFTFFVTLLTVLGCFVGDAKVSASQISATGNTANDAVITDQYGDVISNPADTSRYQSYNVKWNFSIPNSENIQAGDTLPFYLPQGMTANADLNFEVKNDQGDVVGTFSIKSGATSGVLTFNNFFEQNIQKSRHGSIEITANGSKTTTQQGWHLNKTAYINNDGKVTYNIAINAGDKGYTKVELNDDSNLNQSVIASSVVAQEGYDDAQGNFVPQKTITPQVTVNGTNTKFVFTNVKGIVNITYNVNAPEKGTLKNGVVMHAYQGNGGGTPIVYVSQASITYNGNGNITGIGNSSSSSSVVVSSSSKKSSSSSVKSSLSSSKKSSSSSVKSSSSSNKKSSSSSVKSSSSSSKKSSSSSVKSSSSSNKKSSSSSVKSSSSNNKKSSSSSVKSSSSNNKKSSSSSVKSSSSSSKKSSSSSVKSSSSSKKNSSSSVKSSSSSSKKNSSVKNSSLSNKKGSSSISSSTAMSRHHVSSMSKSIASSNKNTVALSSNSKSSLVSQSSNETTTKLESTNTEKKGVVVPAGNNSSTNNSSKSEKQGSNKTLPQTGEKAISAGVIVIGLVLVAVAFIEFKKFNA